MKHLISFLTFILIFQLQIMGQDLKLQKAKELIPEAKYIRLNPSSQRIDFIKFETQTPQRIKNEEFPQYLKQSLKLSEEHSFIQISELKDKLGESHIRYQQTLNGIPVEGMVFIGHFKENNVIRANGGYTNRSVQPVPKVFTQFDAFSIAKNAVKSKEYKYSDEEMSENYTEVYLLVNETPVLCYKYDIYSLVPLDRKFVYINARSGSIEKIVSRIHDTEKTGTAHTLYRGQETITTDSISAESFRLYDENRGAAIHTLDMNVASDYNNAIEITDKDNIWDSTENNFNAAYDVHWGTEMTYDFYLNTFGRNSYDNKGSSLVSYFNYGLNYNNAYWDGERMTYGQGDGISYLPFTSLDIVAHEISHGVTEHTANLEYSYESGALNESFSDIFAVLADFYVDPANANYLVGEQISMTGNPIRNMMNPNSLLDPDTYLGNYWVTGSGDYGGVHTNSSVSNYWFYLLAEGGSGINDNGDAYNITGIGIEKAGEIAYRNLTVYLTQYSQYSDARTYSIQSAIDLYGICSQEVISVTNAWYAVGVGEPFDHAVNANLYLSQNYSCSYPVEIQLVNESINADSVQWYSNDAFVGSDSLLMLNLTSPGYYNLKLIAYGAQNCNSTDTLKIDSAIFVSNTGSPINAQCSPLSTYQLNEGINYFSLETIKNHSSSSVVSYEDFTCSTQATLKAGQRYPFQINTLATSGEVVYIWLDANNNGLFESSEKLFESEPGNLHTGAILIPAVSNYNTPLRLRIGSDRVNYPLYSACTQPTYGHYEDYTVFIEENTTSPIANFVATPTNAGVKTLLTFNDISENLPTSFNWKFEGGTPSTSDQQNPQVYYNTIGTYDVELIVSNQYGSDTISRNNYITISNEYIIGEDETSISDIGKLYDSGGETGNYSNSENIEFVIMPQCADSIILNFEMINLESDCDRIKIYDGNKTTGNLIWTSTNNNLPGDLFALSGSMTVVFTSDESITFSGFEANWRTTFAMGLEAPIAVIAQDVDEPAFNSIVNFKDLSINEPYSWSWNINNEYYSFEKDISHKFTESGEKKIELIVTNCHSADTAQKIIYVQEPPEISIGIRSYSDTIAVGDSLEILIPVSNLSSTGDLVVSLFDTILSPQIFLSNEYSINLSGNYFQDFINTEFSYTAYFSETEELKGQKVLISQQSGFSYLIEFLNSKGAEVETLNENPNPDLDEYAFILIDDFFESHITTDKILSYQSNGGHIIIAGDNSLSYYNSILSSTGIFLSDLECYNGTNNTIYNHPLTENIPTYQIGEGALATVEVSGNASLLISDNNGRGHCSYSKLGNSQILVISDEAFMDAEIMLSGHKQILSNFIDYCHLYSNSIFTYFENNSIIIGEMETDSLQIKIKTENAIGGIYNKSFLISSNDTASDKIIFPVNIVIEGKAMANYESDSISFDLAYVNNGYSKQLKIKNVGTDSLIIDSIRVSNQDFSIAQYNHRVAVDNDVSVNISLNPSVNKNYLDTLIIYSNSYNDSIHYVELTALSDFPPVLISDTDTIKADLITWDSTSYKFRITNAGIAELILKDIAIESASENKFISESLLADVNILNYSTSVSNEFRSSIDKVNGTYYYTSTLNSEMLDTFDVVIIGDNAYLPGSNISLIQSYIRNGGGILITGDNSQYNFNQLTKGSGLSFNDATSCNNGLAPYIANHQITREIDSVYIGYSDYVSSSIIVDSINYNNIALVKDNFSNVFSAAGTIGKGRIVTIADKVLAYNSATNYNFELKCIEWLANLNPWLTVENFHSDTLQSGETSSFDVAINAAGLNSGTFNKNVVISSNDPERERFIIPVSINVTGAAIISISDSMILFDTTFTNYSAEQTIKISNKGTEELIVSDINSNNSNFTVNQTSFSVNPDSFKEISVYFNPVASENHTGVLSIQSNSKGALYTNIELSGTSILPPAISVSTEAIEAQMNQNNTQERILTIDNSQGNSNLTYNILLRNDDNPTNSILPDVLNQLNNRYQEINSLIPNRFNFTDGVTGYSISDGGSDMFDGGNYIYFNNTNNYLVYSDNKISELYNQGIYFTRKFDGLFVFVGELENTTSFHIKGNLGVKPSDYDYTTIKKDFGAKSYTGFIARMSDASRPSVNHLIIVEGNEDASQEFIMSNDNYYQNINNLDSKVIIHHLLFSGENGSYITNQEMESIMNSYLNVINPDPTWLSINIKHGTIKAKESKDLNLTLSTMNLDLGTYHGSIEVQSNDPGNQTISIPVTLNVVNNTPPHILSELDNLTIDLCQVEPINLNQYIVDTEKDLLLYNIENTNPDIILPEIINDSLLYFNPLSVGASTISLDVSDGINQPIEVSFDIEVKEGNKIELLQKFSDISMEITDASILIDLKDYFGDEDNDIITYNIILENEEIASYELNTDYLEIDPLSSGSTIVTIIATDNKCGTITESFNLSISDMVGLSSISVIEFSVYPNPAIDNITIQSISNQDIDNISFFDTKGTELSLPFAQSLNDQKRFDISNLEPGVYLIQIEARDTKSILRFVKK